MAEKAAEVVQDILQELVVQAAEQPITADESQTTIRYMNRYMTQLAALGTSLGYTKVDNLGDDVTIPDGAIMGMIKNVALYIANQYDVPVSQTLLTQAEEGLRAMRKLASTLQPTLLPCTLPIGSGNEPAGKGGSSGDANSGNGFGGHFYPCEADQILAENNQNILIEEGTPNGS